MPSGEDPFPTRSELTSRVIYSMITLLTDTKRDHMAKSRGRDVSITRGTLPLSTTRYVVNPLGVSIPSPTPIVIATPHRSALKLRNAPDVTPQPTPVNRVAKNASGNNLYRSATPTKEVSICKNRSIRKEVLFALGHGGRNGMKTARYTRNSKVKCK